MKPEPSYLNVTFGLHTITRRVGYNEDMKRALYECTCSKCGGKATVWIEIETGQWSWERTCFSRHKREVIEQRYALLLACAA